MSADPFDDLEGTRSFFSRLGGNDADSGEKIPESDEDGGRTGVKMAFVLFDGMTTLQGKRAKTNASAYEWLAPYCSEVEKARVVRDGRIFSGLSSGMRCGN